MQVREKQGSAKAAGAAENGGAKTAGRGQNRGQSGGKAKAKAGEKDRNNAAGNAAAGGAVRRPPRQRRKGAVPGAVAAEPSAPLLSSAGKESPAAQLSTAAIEGELPDELREEFAALPLRQQVFVTEYLSNGFNCARAARAAGYSESSAGHHGARITRNRKIARILAEHTGRSMARREITAERVLDEMAKLAFFDPRRIFDASGALLLPSQMGDDEAAAIAGMDLRQMQDGSELKKVKLADKAKSLEMLGRYLRLFTERVEHTGSLGVQLIHDVPRPEREGA